MTDERDSLLREVDEELRREQMQKLWERYNGLIIAAVAAVVFGVGGYKLYESRRISAAEAAGASFASASELADDKKNAEAEKAFANLSETGPSGYAALAKLQMAATHAKAGKTADAFKLYEQLGQSSGDELLKNFAQLQAASLRLGEADYGEMLSRLTPLAGDGAPFSASAKELLGLAAYKAKKYDDARKYLEPLLIDPNASETVQDRVKVVMGDIATAELAKNAPAKPAASAPIEVPGLTIAPPDEGGKPVEPAVVAPPVAPSPATAPAKAPEKK